MKVIDKREENQPLLDFAESYFSKRYRVLRNETFKVVLLYPRRKGLLELLARVTGFPEDILVSFHEGEKGHFRHVFVKDPKYLREIEEACRIFEDQNPPQSEFEEICIFLQ